MTSTSKDLTPITSKSRFFQPESLVVGVPRQIGSVMTSTTMSVRLALCAGIHRRCKRCRIVVGVGHPVDYTQGAARSLLSTEHPPGGEWAQIPMPLKKVSSHRSNAATPSNLLELQMGISV